MSTGATPPRPPTITRRHQWRLVSGRGIGETWRLDAYLETFTLTREHHDEVGQSGWWVTLDSTGARHQVARRGPASTVQNSTAVADLVEEVRRAWAAVHQAKACPDCFQLPSANDTCGCP